MPIDINGYALSNEAGLKFGVTATKVIAADYGIRDPMLPGMMGSATAGGSTYKIYPFPVNNVNPNIGGCWAIGTYRFTAPVAGIYYVAFGGIVGNGTAAGMVGYYGIVVNGVCVCFSYHNSNSLWELHHNAVMVKVAAGDTISWAFNIAPAPDSGTVSGAYQGNHNVCTIWLVG